MDNIKIKGLDGKVAIHCRTPELYAQVLDLIPMNAEKRKSMDFGFDKHGNETCIADDRLYYGRIDFWKSEGYTIICAAEFIAMNTEPEAAPAWSFKTDEELEDFIAGWVMFKSINGEQASDKIVRYMASKRFSLTCQDGVVTDPEQRVYYVEGMDICGNLAQFAPKDLTCFTTESAALNHRRHNTPAIKLSDMEYDKGTYFMSKETAENLVNERINGTK